MKPTTIKAGADGCLHYYCSTSLCHSGLGLEGWD